MQRQLQGQLPPAGRQQEADPLAPILDRAAPVQIGGEMFNLPVTVTGPYTAQVHFPDGSELHLIRPAAGDAYVPASGPPAPQASSAAEGSAERPIVLLSAATAEDSSTDFNLPALGVADALHQPLFDLEEESEIAQFIKPEPNSEVGPGWTTGRRAAPDSPEANKDGAGHRHKRTRPNEHASAEQRWSAYCTSRGVAWAALNNNQQLLLQAAAVSLPSKEQYAELQRRQAEQAGAPVLGQAIVQAHSEQRFQNLARDIADVPQHANSAIATLQRRINKLGETALKDIAQTMLNDAKGNSALQGGKPGTVTIESAPVIKLRATILFLEKVAEKTVAAPPPSPGKAWLQTTLAAMLAGVPTELQAAPDTATSNRCVTALATALGIAETNVHQSKPAIKALTGVDLTFHNATRESAAAPDADDPIPADGKGALLRGRLKKLQLPANRTAFTDFFGKRDTIRAAGDPPGKNIYAAPVTKAMLLVEQLDSRRDAAGHPAPQDVDAWLKDLFQGALNLPNPITDWKTLGTPGDAQLQAIRRKLGAQPEIGKGLTNFFPFILSHTGISLWTK